MIGLMRNSGSADVFLHDEYGFSSVEVTAILGKGCGVQGQNYVVWLQGSKMTVGFCYRNLILGMYSFSLIKFNISHWSKG